MPMRVVAYYERWSGRLAARLARNASVQSTPIIADQPTEKFGPRRPYLFTGFRRVPQLGWEYSSNDQDPAKKIPAARWVAIRQWLGWRPQPRGGWTVSSQQDVSLTVPGPSWTPVKAWVRWHPQPALGWATPGDVPVV